MGRSGGGLRHHGAGALDHRSRTQRPRRRAAAERPGALKRGGRRQRENKIHAVGIPDPKLVGTPVFLDVEGLPDRDFYYLIGIRVQATEGNVQYSFWADDAKEEKLMWNDFLTVLSQIANPHLIHYGSYETTFLKRMCERAGPETLRHCG
jgi:predicted RecB family nuclease